MRESVRISVPLLLVKIKPCGNSEAITEPLVMVNIPWLVVNDNSTVALLNDVIALCGLVASCTGRRPCHIVGFIFDKISDI